MLERAYKGELSPRAAIKAKCFDCCNFDAEEAATCRSEICPVWAYNPYRVARAKGETAAAESEDAAAQEE
jgi:hypothetical protein